jgi:hypothetical protein
MGVGPPPLINFLAGATEMAYFPHPKRDQGLDTAIFSLAILILSVIEKVHLHFH